MGFSSYIMIGAGVLVVIYFIRVYNKLVKKRMEVNGAWANINAQLQRRYDLIPNLVEVARGYMKHEKELLERVTAARSGALSALQNAKGAPNVELAHAEETLNREMHGLMISVEAYPDLKANTNMMQLTEEITTTENKISFARQYYNDAVSLYNTLTEVIPSNIVAKMFGFRSANFFELKDFEEMSKAPQVQFS